MALFESILISEFNVVVVNYDKNSLMVKISLNGKDLVECFFWEVNSGILCYNDYLKLGKFRNISEFIEELELFLKANGAKRITVSSKEYDYGK